MNCSSPQISKAPSLILLCLLVSFGTVCAVLLTPALPEISQFFGISEQVAQWSMTVYLVGYALGQLPYGPLANRYGRKPALFIGVLLALLGILICICAKFLLSFPLFLCGRLLMASGACVGLMMAFTLLNDFYFGKKAHQFSSYMMLAFAVLPALSLSIGGYLIQSYGWTSCFYCLAFYTCGLGCIAYKQVHNPPQFASQPISSITITRQMGAEFMRPTLILYALLIGCCTAAIYLFSTFSPFVAIQFFRLSETQFGYFHLIPAMGILLGAIVSAQLGKTRAASQNISLGIINLGIAVGIMLIGMFFRPSAVGLFCSMAYVNFALTFVISSASVLAVADTHDKANASSIMSFINLSVGAISVGMAQQVAISPLSIPLMLCIIFIIMGVLWSGKCLSVGTKIPGKA